MPYVQRDESNKIISLYAAFQEGLAEELLDEDDPEVVAFNVPVGPSRVPSIIAQARLSVGEDGNVGGINGDTGLAGAFILTDGYIYVQFQIDQTTDQYIVSPTPLGPYLCYVANGDQYSDSFALTCTDLSGNPATPGCIPLIVTKVQ